jgi:hypothetical protein
MRYVEKTGQSQVYSESFATRLGRYIRRSFKLERGYGLPNSTVTNTSVELGMMK